MRKVGTTMILRTSCSAPPSVTPSSCPRTVVLVCTRALGEQEWPCHHSDAHADLDKRHPRRLHLCRGRCSLMKKMA